MTNVALRKTFRWRLKKVAVRTGINLLAALFLVASPILIPIALIGSYFADRRKCRVAGNTPCVNCGRVLGIESLELSDRRAADYGAEQQRLHPGVKFRLVRTVFAICKSCGAEYGYRDGAFTLIKPENARRLVP
jgi:hypothetical protein